MMQTRPAALARAAAPVALLAAVASAQTSQYTIVGTVANDRLGTSCSACADVNGDGRPDLIVGATENGNIFTVAEGYVRVYSGANASIVYTFNGAVNGDSFGAAVGSSDVNLDTRPDIVVGAPLSNAQAGNVYVFNGATGSAVPLFTFPGAAGEQFGSSVAGCGDVNNDGRPDVIAGGPAANSNRGIARVYSGLTGAVLWTINGTNVGDFLGFSVDGVGDVNNDGFADFAVGSRGAGAKIYSGQNASVIYSFPVTGTDRLGSSVAGAGDVNGDGRPDFILGAPQDGNILSPGTGYANVYSGISGALLWSFLGDNNGDRFGWSVGGGKDINGDGRMDLIVGADQNAAVPVGYARVHSGIDGALLYTVNGIASGDRLGTCVDLTGDLDGDGLGDFAAGAPGTTVGSLAQAGAVKTFETNAPPVFQAFCFGDNLDPNVTSDCPCGNFGAAGRGCANSTNASGALLSVSGSPNPDTVVMTASGMPAASTCIFLQGDALTDIVFGDGVVCAGGNIIRLRSKTATSGSASYPQAGDPSVSLRGLVTPGSGVLRFYATYYRNAAAGFCPPATFNVTNGWKMTW